MGFEELKIINKMSIFFSGRGEILEKYVLIFCVPILEGGGVKWEKDNVPLYELFFLKASLMCFKDCKDCD